MVEVTKPPRRPKIPDALRQSAPDLDRWLSDIDAWLYQIWRRSGGGQDTFDTLGDLATLDAVDTGQIQDAAVATEKIAPNAVTEIDADESSFTFGSSGASAGWTTVNDISVTVGTGQKVLLFAAAVLKFGKTASGGTVTPSGQYRITRNSTVVRGPTSHVGTTASAVGSATLTGQMSIVDLDEPAAGTYTYNLQIYDTSSGGTDPVVSFSTDMDNPAFAAIVFKA